MWWYRNIQAGPLYRRDLDIVAAKQVGEIGAFCTIWYNDVTRIGVCVLVGIAHEHRRHGLGKAVILEGLRRVQRMGGTRVLANGYDAAANALHGAALRTVDLSDSWANAGSCSRRRRIPNTFIACCRNGAKPVVSRIERLVE